MAIQRSDPARDLQHLQERVRRMCDEALGSSGAAGGAATWTPPADLLEEPGRYVLRADLPGVGPAEVEVLVDQGCLVLRGERRREVQAPREGYLRAERPEGPFRLHIALPPSVDLQRIEASQRNGVLEVVLPKRGNEAPNRIPVAGGPQ